MKQVDMTHSRTPVALTPTATLSDRLLARGVRTPTGCLEWSGSRDLHGYGWIHLAGKTVKVHRAAFAVFVRPIVDGELICHHCDNPPCFEPSHLFAGTVLDNTRDMIAKGRRRPDLGYIKGETHHQAILTEDAVRRLRTMRSEGATYPVLMAEFGVKKSTVHDICSARTWRHIL
jgi:hypothetical protein